MPLNLTGPLTKRSNEKRLWPIDFTDSLEAGISVTSTWSILVFDNTGTDVSATMIDAGSKRLVGNLLEAIYQDGADGQRYRVVVSMTLTNGEVLEEVFYFDVRD